MNGTIWRRWSHALLTAGSTAALALAFTLSTLAPVESVSCADPEWSETCVGVGR